MSAPSERGRISRRQLLAALAAGSAYSMANDDLPVRIENDALRVAAPRLHFLTGASLDRLKNGLLVPFDFQLSLSVDSRTNLFDRAVERIGVSYDVWEEKYSATRSGGPSTLRGDVRRSHNRTTMTNLSAPSLERWCVENMAVSTSTLASGQTLWVRLEVRSGDARDANPLFGDSGVSLSRLIDLFSHPPRSGQQRWALESGPMRLSEVFRMPSRGA